MPTIPNPTPEERAFLEEADRVIAEDEAIPPDERKRLLREGANLQAKMDDQALTNAALGAPGPARDVHNRVMNMPYEQFEREFADVLNANACDEDEGEAA